MIPFGIIGTSWITESWIKSADSTGQWKLAAIYSRGEQKAKDFVNKNGYHGSTIHTTIDSLVKDAPIKAVYVASPNSLHYEQVKTLLLAGKHVIVEKPATSTSKEYTELFDLAKKQKVFLIEAYRHIQEANFKILKQSLSKLGGIYGASLTYASYSSRYNNVLAGEVPNIFNLDLSGGSLVDLGVYPISFAVALFGKPESATYKPILISSGADAGGLIVLNYKDFGVSINQSKCYTSTAPSEIYGEKGTIVLNATTDIERVDFVDARSKEVESLAGKKAGLNLSEEAREFARIIESGDWEAAGRLAEIGRQVTEVTEELRRQNGILFGVEKERA